MAYKNNIHYIQSGEPITAGVANRPSRELAQRTEALRKMFKEASLGEALYLYDVPLDEDTRVGMPVYWNSKKSCYAPAYVSVIQECSTGEYILGPESNCIGIVKSKSSVNSGTLITFGVDDIPEIRSFLPAGTGNIYLGSEPGTLTFDRLAIPSLVGAILGPSDACDTRLNVYVHPNNSGRGFEHTHFSYKLDPSLWKSASEFDNAPEDAVFGYDVSLDAKLRRYFPPIPVTACTVTIDWDGKKDDTNSVDETFGSREIPVNEENSLIHIDLYGIWWMSSDISPDERQDSDNTVPYRGFRVTIHYSRVTYSNHQVYVTSLRPDKGEPFEFVDCEGDESRSGDLYLRFTLGKESVDATTFDGKAVQELTNDWKQKRSRVLNGIRAGGSGVSVYGTPFDYFGTTYHGGLVTIKVRPYAEDYEIRPQVVKLSEALEAEYSNIQYIALPHSRTSSISMKMEVPGVFGDILKLKMRFLFLAKVGGTYPALNLKVMRLPRPTSGSVSLTNVAAFQSIEFDSAVLVTAGTLFEVESEEIEVSEGDTLIFVLSRPNTAVYASEVGIVRVAGILNSEDAL